MTKHLHRNEDLELNNNALQSLYNLSIISNKICLSGEGDPLANWKSIGQIIKNNPDNIHYELITSSFWNKHKTKLLLSELSLLCKTKNSTLAYRISIDEFHAKETNRDVLEILVALFSENNFQNITLQIRSITGQEDYLFNRLQQLFGEKNIKLAITALNEIEYEVLTTKVCIRIQFKPTVNPDNFNYIDDWNIDKYIEFLEKSRNSAFHIGLLNDSILNPQFDITVNPNGDIVLYGVEPFVLGNITKEVIDYEILKHRVKENSELQNIISRRFIELIQAWRNNSKKAELIKRVNNPFWIIRNLHDEKLLSV